MNFIILVFWVVFALYIWLQTDAVVKWLQLFRIKFSKYEEFNERAAMMPGLKYPDFLMGKYPCFFTQLIACQECLAVWLNILGFLIFHGPLMAVCLFPVSVIFSWVGIAALKSTLKKLYE